MNIDFKDCSLCRVSFFFVAEFMKKRVGAPLIGYIRTGMSCSVSSGNTESIVPTIFTEMDIRNISVVAGFQTRNLPQGKRVAYH